MARDGKRLRRQYAARPHDESTIIESDPMAIDLSEKRIAVTGGSGFLGRAVCRRLALRGCRNVAIVNHRDYDLTAEADVIRLYADLRPQVMLHLAAEVGGIGANRKNPGRFFYANMAMALNLIEQARIAKIEKFIHVGTICSYPKYTPLPFNEDNLWDGYPEQTNAPYGIAKKAAMVMLEGYHRQYGLKSTCVLPVNLYGPGDNFDPPTSHVIPALIRKCIEAQQRGIDHIVCWGTGDATREFLYVDDAAEGILRAAEVMDTPTPINLGTNTEISIKNLVELIAKLANFTGEIRWDRERPDGQPRRCVSTSRANELLDWKAKVNLEEGLRETTQWWRNENRNITDAKEAAAESAR